MPTTDPEEAGSIVVPNGENAVWIGWPAIVQRLQRAISERYSSKPVLVVECYPGVDGTHILRELRQPLQPALAVHTSATFHAPKRIETLVQPFLREPGSHLPRRRNLILTEFFDAELLWHARRQIEDLRDGPVLVVGCGASLIAWGHVLVYADLTREAARSRLCQEDGSNLGMANHALASEEKLRIASRVDWPVADRWKRPLIMHWNFVLEADPPDAPRLFDGEAVHLALRRAVQGPFCFALRPQENPHPRSPTPQTASNDSRMNPDWENQSLLLSFGAAQLKMPALNLLMGNPRALVGESDFRRFGFHCPLPLLPPDLPLTTDATVRDEEGWREERIALPRHWDRIEARRLHFTRSVPQHTQGRLMAVKLVEGAEVGVESPTKAFAPIVFQSGRTFLIPAAVGEFVLRPAGPPPKKSWVVLKTFIRP